MLPLRMLGILMLMFLLCDAESSCPDDINPLTLDPPAVIGEYGDTVLVNCSSSEEYHDGISFKLGNTSYNYHDDEEFITGSLQLSDWSVKAECRIKMDETRECSRELGITIYKTPDEVKVSAVDPGPMMEGGEHMLVCDIINVAPVQNLTVIWYRDSETIHTQTFTETTVTPVNVSSSLRVTADRHHNGALYKCVAELHLGPELIPTATSQPYTAVVHYGPLITSCSGLITGVENEFSLDKLPCRADGNPPPTIHWYYKSEEINADEVLNRNDSGEYKAVFENRIARRHISINITIEYGPSFACDDHYEVKEGGSSQAMCEPEGLPQPKITWLKDGEEIPTPQRWTRHDSGQYTLRATNNHGEATHTLDVDVLYCPLILTPAKVVVRFGDPVSINCSLASTTDSLGMGWEAAFRGTGFEDKSSLTWTVEKVEEWNIKPQCYMTRKNGKHCFMRPDITVYKTPGEVKVSAVDPGPMVEGREHTLVCGITNVAPVQNLTVIWYRDNEKLSTETFNGTTVTPVNEYSTLRVTADRHHNGALYKCEAELHLGPELILTATSQPYTAVVHYGPSFACLDHYEVKEGGSSQAMCEPEGLPQPKITWLKDGEEIPTPQRWTRHDSGNYSLRATNNHGEATHTLDVDVLYAPELKRSPSHSTVVEGENVTLTCEAWGNPPPVYKWTCKGMNISASTANLTITQATMSTTYSCTASNRIGTKTTAIYVRVVKRQRSPPMNIPEAPEEIDCPLILTPAKVAVRFGDPVSINCSLASTTDSLGMGWEAAFGGTEFENKSSLTWTVENLEEWNINPQCNMTWKNGKQCFMTPDITVYKTPDEVKVSAVDPGPMMEGREHTLVCDIINVAPVQNLTVIWYRDSETIHTQTFTETTVTPVNVSSSLRVTADRHHNGALYKCVAELHLGPELIQTAASQPYTAVVHYGPLITSCSGLFTGVENEFSLDKLPCRADGNPPPTIHWYYKSEEINADEVLNRNDSGEYKAVFENRIARRHISINITIEYGPSFACDDHYEVKEGGSSQAMCEPEGLPQPKITWLKDGEEIPTPQRWTRHDSGQYTLRATNNHGEATHTLDVDVLYCPLILTPAKVTVRFGDPVSINCSLALTTDSLGMGWEAPLGGTGFEDKSSLTWTVEKLEEWNIKPQCFMTRKNGKQCFMRPDITVYKTPDEVKVSAVDPGPMMEGGKHMLVCDIINVAPVQNLTVIWYRDNEKLSTETFTETTVTPVSVSSSLRVTADRHHNGALYKCVAELHLGQELIPTAASLPYTAVVHYAPVFKENNYTQDVITGENVTLPCTAEGNPPPVIQWKYMENLPNVILINNTRWHQRNININITRATSTNNGVYNCTATNKVGTVTRAVTLAVKDKSRGLPPMYIWLLVALLLTIIIIPIILFVRSRQNKHGQYNFVPSGATDIPMNPTSNGVKA